MCKKCKQSGKPDFCQIFHGADPDDRYWSNFFLCMMHQKYNASVQNVTECCKENHDVDCAINMDAGEVICSTRLFVGVDYCHQIQA
jgi:hypothetical protein